MTFAASSSEREGAPRPSARARVVLLDDTDRLLLFSVRNEDGSSRWFSPGGGLRPGETHAQAALRELREETGLTGVPLGPAIWQGRPFTTVRHGIRYEVRQRYFLVRTPSFEVDTEGFEDLERSTITGYRWWTVGELAATTDLLRPAGLPELVATLLTDGPPAHPIMVAG